MILFTGSQDGKKYVEIHVAPPMTSVNFKWAHSKFWYFMKSMPMCTLAICKLWERAWRDTARLQGWRERERERRWMCWQHARQLTFWTMVRVWRSRDKAGYEWHVCWLQVHSWRDRSYIAWIPLLAHGLTVKLSPDPCSHSNPGWTNSCMSV